MPYPNEENGPRSELTALVERLVDERVRAALGGLRKLEYNGTKPERQRQSDVGYDLRANLKESVWIPSGQQETIPLGTRLGLPHGHVALVVPRSGLAAKHGITIQNTPGTIDPGYRGELMAIIRNDGDKPFRVVDGDRIAQLLILKAELPEMVQVEDLGYTDRGANRFGSSGIE